MSETTEHRSLSPEQIDDRLAEALRAASHVTVEFGTADTPLFKVGANDEYDRDNLYVGVNIDPLQHNHLQQHVDSVDGIALLGTLDEDQKIERLPVPNESADMVFMGNVFGEPNDENIMYHFKGGDGTYHGHSSLDAKRSTLQEAKRIMKPDGHIVILENNTPYLGEQDKVRYSKERYTAMVNVLLEEGFTIDEALNNRSDEWNEVVSHFAQPNEWWSQSSYLVIASKQ